LTKTDVVTELVDMNNADPHEVRELINQSKAVIIGMPPQSSPINQTILSTIIASINGKQGWDYLSQEVGKMNQFFLKK